PAAALRDQLHRVAAEQVSPLGVAARRDALARAVASDVPRTVTQREVDVATYREVVARGTPPTKAAPARPRVSPAEQTMRGHSCSDGFPVELATMGVAAPQELAD